MESVRRVRLLVAGPRLTEARDLHQLLAQQRDIVVIDEILEMARVPGKVISQGPDVVLLRARGTAFALEATGSLLAEIPNAKLLVVVNSFTLDEAERILERGARGVLSVGELYAQGMRAVHAVHAGEIWGSRALLSRIVETLIKHSIKAYAFPGASLNLTERENEIIKLLRTGSSNKEIALQLKISDKTVKTHLHNIFGKLQIHRRQKILPAFLS